MGFIIWFQGVIAWLQTDGRWDLVTLGLALATFIYVGIAIAVSIRTELQARDEQAQAHSRVASVKRTASQPNSAAAA